MSEPSKAAVEKANALVRAATPPNVLSSAEIDPSDSYIDDAFARFIDHVSEVRDWIAEVWQHGTPSRADVLGMFDAILPDPEPDVLEQSMRELEWTNCDTLSEDLRAELAKRGYEIRKVQP